MTLYGRNCYIGATDEEVKVLWIKLKFLIKIQKTRVKGMPVVRHNWNYIQILSYLWISRFLESVNWILDCCFITQCRTTFESNCIRPYRYFRLESFFRSCYCIITWSERERERETCCWCNSVWCVCFTIIISCINFIYRLRVRLFPRYIQTFIVRELYNNNPHSLVWFTPHVYTTQ